VLHGLARVSCVLPILLGGAATLRGQEQVSEFQSGAEVVVLDVVVRDDSGGTVRDLDADEVRVFEDGVEQEILSFRLQALGEDSTSAPMAVGGAEARDAFPPVPRESAAPTHANLVTLVFDQLGPDGRRVARAAGRSLARLTDRPDLLVSVFQVRESLRLVQQFTTDREVLQQAVDAATGEVNTQYTDATDLLEEAAEDEREARRRLEAVGAVSTYEQANAAARLGQEVDIARMAVDALRLTQTLQREQQGHASLYSLLALAKQQQRLAGRKTILYFSEGLQVPPSLEHVLRQAVSEANRANVSIYAVDARGLTSVRELESTRQTLQQAADASRQQMMNRGLTPVTREQVFALETAENALRMDVQGALRDLAEGTGGSLIADTNDVEGAIERAVGDMRGYYEIVYAPTNSEYDGSFRRIGVDVSRKDVRVQARSGYFALPPGEGTATFAFEVDLLRAMRRYPLPYEFAVRAAPFRFGPEEGGVRHTLVAEIPLAGIRFEGDERGEADRAHISILAVLRDRTGLVVEKFSEDSPVFLPHQQRALFKQGNAVFLRSFTLPPGRYTLETAVVDQLSGHHSVQRADIDVPKPGPGMVVSEVALIKRTEDVPSGALASDDPFRQGGTRLVPWLSEPRVARADPLSVFLVAYPPNGSRTDVLFELVRDGQVVSQSLSELPPADAAGRAPFVATVPTEALAPGSYEVRLLVKQGGLVAQRKIHFVLGAGGRS
jgi:VWFA-related protein